MKFMVSVIDSTTGQASHSEMADITAFNDHLRAQGHWVFADGLGAPDTATVIDNRGPEPLITKGPFLQAQEYVAGFWILEAPSLEVALQLAAEGSRCCNRRVEVRPFLRPPE